MEKKIITTNRKAFHDYTIFEKYVAGIVLTGTEIKSMRQGKCSIKESYCKIDRGEMYVYSMNISPYEQGNIFNTDPMRPKKLLLHRREIMKIQQALTLKGLTVVPLQVYINDEGRAKIEIAVANTLKSSFLMIL